MNKLIFSKITKSLCLVFTVLFITACQLELFVEEKPSLEEYTSVSFKIQAYGQTAPVARTALPVFDSPDSNSPGSDMLSAYKYTLSCTHGNNLSTEIIGEKCTIDAFRITKTYKSHEKYIFTLIAYEGETEIFTGSTTIESLEGSQVTVPIVLIPVKNLLGRAKVDISFPDDGVIKKVKACYSTNSAVEPDEEIGIEDNTKVEYKVFNLPSGIEQYFIFEFYDSQDAVVYRRAESLYVIGDRLSASNITIDSNYYYRKSVSVKLYKDNIEWKNSNNLVKLVNESSQKEYSLAANINGEYVGDVSTGSYNVYVANSDLDGDGIKDYVNTHTAINVNGSASGQVYFETVQVPPKYVTLSPSDGVLCKDLSNNLIVPKGQNFNVKAQIKTGYEVKNPPAQIGGKTFTPATEPVIITLNQTEIGSESVSVTGVTPIVYTIIYDDGVFVLNDIPEDKKTFTIESEFDLPVLTKEGFKFSGWEAKLSNGTSVILTKIEPGLTVEDSSRKLQLDAVWIENENANYQIEYLFEKVDSSEYTADASIKLHTFGSGKIGTQTKITAGDEYAPVISGFKTPVITNITIPETGGVVEVRYARNDVTLTFNAGDGGSFTSGTSVTITGKYNSQISSSDLPVPHKTDYKFLGWNPDVPAKYPANNNEYTAQWEQEYASYTVKYYYQNVDDSEYQEAIEERDTSHKALIGSTPSVISPRKEGFTSNRVDSSVVTADGLAEVKVYYDRKTIRITLDFAGGAIPGNTQTVWEGKYEANTNLPSETPVKQSYEFIGWQKTGDSNTSELPATYPDANVTYTAIWNQTYAKFTVNVYKQYEDGRYTTVKDFSFEYGGVIGRDTGITNVIVNDKYSIPTGFAVDRIENTTVQATGTVVSVYYKRNEITYTFNANGGKWGDDSVKNITALYGGIIEPPENPTNGTLVFAGWGANASSTTVTTVDQTADSSGKSYYAIWKSRVDTGDSTDPIDPTKLNVDFTPDKNGNTITATFTNVSGTNSQDWTYIWQVNNTIVSNTNSMTYTGLAGMKYEITLIAYFKNIPYVVTHTVTLDR